jgi:poly(A) polymerase
MEAVEALFDNGLLSDILGSAPRLDRLARLIAIETASGREPSAPLRLAALAMFVAEDAPRLAARFKFSNAEQAVLALGAEEVLDAGLPEESVARRLLYRHGPGAYMSHVLLTWASRGADTDDASWQRALTLPERWEVPVFPLRGPDVTALADLKGPEIGEALRAIEQHWVEGGFAEDRDQLLALAKAWLG